MIKGLWGKKVGMTQLFIENNVVPVTVINVAGWYVLQVKTEAADGYDAIQVGCLRKRYEQQGFKKEFLKQKKKHFLYVREVAIDKNESLEIGQSMSLSDVLEKKQHVDVVGTSKGAGFAGVMRRHDFSGGPASHGSTFHRAPGSLSNLCSEGKVPKGKAMPGHMGVDRVTTQNLEVVGLDQEKHIVLVKGAVAGKPGSFVFMRKRG
jgi:large subunit ribosomal protein L3